MPWLQMTCATADLRPDPGRPARRDSLSAPSPTLGRARIARASVLGGLSLVLAAGAHLLGGGSLPGPGVLLVVTALLAMLAAVVTAHRLRFGPLLGLLAGQQLALHAVFSLAGAAQSCTVGGADAVHAMSHHVATSCAATGMVMDPAVPGWLMWAGHLLAVAGTAWLLARGEAWLWRALDRVAVAAGLRRLRRTSRRGTASFVYRAERAQTRGWAPAAPRGPPLH